MAEAKRVTNIREKFGIDYLLPSRSTESESLSAAQISSPADPLIERALTAYGGRILTMLSESPDKSGRLHDIVDKTGLGMETMLGITDRMVRSGLISIVESDKYGNHKISITPTGEELLKQ